MSNKTRPETKITWDIDSLCEPNVRPKYTNRDKGNNRNPENPSAI
jgi:hypothetical protein